MSICNKDHRHDEFFKLLPMDQGGLGRHKCAACAYDKGFEMGIHLQENMHLNLDELPESQAGIVRHKSPHAAFAKGYLEGVEAYYRNK